MEFNRKEVARGAVLTKLGLSSLVTTAKVDSSEFHHAHVERQNIPAQFIIDGLTIEAPAGIYHPPPESSAEFFIRDKHALNSSNIAKILEIGAGFGNISLCCAA